MLNIAFDEFTMSKTRVYEWYKRFQDGREDVEDDERMVVLAHQQPMKTWKKWKKWLWTIAES